MTTAYVAVVPYQKGAGSRFTRETFPYSQFGTDKFGSYDSRAKSERMRQVEDRSATGRSVEFHAYSDVTQDIVDFNAAARSGDPLSSTCG